jgi:hypothetical protein
VDRRLTLLWRSSFQEVQLKHRQNQRNSRSLGSPFWRALVGCRIE